MKHKLILLFILLSGSTFAQYTSSAVDKIIASAPFFDSEKGDTLTIIANQLGKFKFPRAKAFSYRLRGFVYDYEEKSDLAIEQYFDFLAICKEHKNIEDEMSAISDIVYAYVNTNQHSKAKPFLVEFLNRSGQDQMNQKKLGVLYNNLGIIYKQENKIDSALWAYNQSLIIKEKLQEPRGIANLKINLSSLYIFQGEYSKALKLSNENISYLSSQPNAKDLCLNLINLSAAYYGLKDFSNAKEASKKALSIANKINVKSFQYKAITALAECDAALGLFQNAYSNLKRSDSLKAFLINEETNIRIAELQEEHNANQRELDNKLLTNELRLEQNKKLFNGLGLFLLSAVILTIALALYKNQQKNRLISEQNEKLHQFNLEKNKLISIVSHDLSSPFSTVKLWAQSISINSKEKDIEEAKSMINAVADFGLNTIEKILQIDENELKGLVLEKIDIADLLKNLVHQNTPWATEKEIEIKVKVKQDQEYIVSDKNLLSRALGNLISNAIKYSHTNSEVIITTFSDIELLYFSIKDNGIGIKVSDIPKLFTAYAVKNQGSNSNVKSHGLGLCIAKRIAQELGGDIYVKSEVGKGSNFTLQIPV